MSHAPDPPPASTPSEELPRQSHSLALAVGGGTHNSGHRRRQTRNDASHRARTGAIATRTADATTMVAPIVAAAAGQIAAIVDATAAVVALATAAAMAAPTANALSNVAATMPVGIVAPTALAVSHVNLKRMHLRMSLDFLEA